MRISPALLVLLCAPMVPAYMPATARVVSTTVSGVVHDSVAGKPLAGALVQLVGADSLSRFGQTVVSDWQGQFAFNDVPDGRYTLGFYHPMLDSLGLEPMLRAVSVAGLRAVHADLAIPSAAHLRTVICGPPSPQNSGAVVIGVVRDARDRSPAAGVTVAAEWVEYSLGKGGLVRRAPRRVTITKESGWFGLCNVPSPGTMTLVASRGADSTDVIEVEVAAGGFLRHELSIGVARTVVSGDTVLRDAVRRDTAFRTERLALPPRRIHLGNGKLSGTVVAVNSGRPLAGAQVAITNGPQTRANERGEWTLADAPAGTRTLEVRAVGYYPARQTVDVIDGAAPVRVALATFKSVLDTMKVIADYDRFSNFAGFRERSRSGLGRFFTGADLAKRQVIVTTDLFRNMQGVFVDSDSDLEQRITMRGVFTERCEPAVYLNGTLMMGMNMSEIDAFVRPKDVVGIEVYSQTQAPPQFQPGLSGCGSLVFWTR